MTVQIDSNSIDKMMVSRLKTNIMIEEKGSDTRRDQTQRESSVIQRCFRSGRAIMDIVNSSIDVDPKNYGEAMRSPNNVGWSKAIDEELIALDKDDAWNVVKIQKGAHALHPKWVFKTKQDAQGGIGRLKARLVACDNEQVFKVNYGLTFAAVIDMSSIKRIFVLARKWKISVKHGDVPNV